MILYPNGNIQAQYKQITSSYGPAYFGLENANGTDGLDYAAFVNDSLAIRYIFPTGVQLTPPEQSDFRKRGAGVPYTLRLANRTGGNDRFDLAVQPGSDWPATLSISQTGVLADWEDVSFQVLVTVPLTATVGDVGQVIVEATSTTTPTFSATALLSTTAASDEIAYLPLIGANSVALVDTALHVELGRIDVRAVNCRSPWRATITPAGDQVYVACYASDTVVIIDTATHTIVAAISGIGRPFDIAFTPEGDYALVGSANANQIAVINTQTHALSAITTPWPTRNIDVHPYLKRAYVSGDGNALLVVDTSTFSLAQPIQQAGIPEGVAVSADGRYVFVTTRYGATLIVLDAFENSVHAILSGINSRYVVDVVAVPDGSAIYVAGLSHGVHVIDGSTFQLLTTIGVGIDAAYLATTCDGDEVWTGGFSDWVPIIDTSTNQVAQYINLTGSDVYGIAICPQHAVKDLLLLPPAQSNNGALGQVVTHQLTLVNATDVTDSFTLSLGASTWPAALSTNTVGPLAHGEIATVQVTVTIPIGAAWYDSATVQVTATGEGDPSFDAIANLTTVADAPPALSTAPAALSSAQPVNQSVDQTLALSNGSGMTLTVEISDVDLTPGIVRLAPPGLPQAEGWFAPFATSDEASQPAPSAPNDVPRAPATGHELALKIQTGRVYTTTTDNENNALTGSPDGDMDIWLCSGSSKAPIEFNIVADRIPAPTGNALTVRAYYDVPTPGEIDEVRLNGVYLGNLSGNTYQWSEKSFTIPSGVVTLGANLVQITIGNDRCIDVDWGELSVPERPADWLHQDLSAATIATNSSQGVVITFDSTGVQPGEYLAAVVLDSNDPVLPYLVVPVTMTVQPTADMGSIAGAISDAWTGLPLTATVELAGVHTLTPRTDYQLWATAGAYTLVVSAPGYASATLPVVITAGGVTAQDVALEPALARLEWLPQTVEASVRSGGQVTRTLLISNTGPMPMDMALFEIDLDFSESAPTPENLRGKRILYDRSHGQPDRGDYSTLIDDAIAAGAEVVENSLFPINANILKSYDILWSNCCGSITWGLSELMAVEQWMRHGGAVVVNGGASPATAGLASIFDILYFDGSCAYGSTTSITPHPISDGVTSINYYAWVCQWLSAGPDSAIVVHDSYKRPNVVAKQTNTGKMVVLASSLFANWEISYADNRLLGNNILGWLARPAYSDVLWLSTSPITSTLPGHSSLPVAVGFAAAALSEGTYQAVLAIEHNDATQSFPVELPVTLTVLPPQDRLHYLPLILVQ